MPRISVTIPDSDLAAIDHFLTYYSEGLCPSKRSEFFRWAALRFMREVEPEIRRRACYNFDDGD